MDFFHNLGLYRIRLERTLLRLTANQPRVHSMVEKLILKWNSALFRSRLQFHLLPQYWALLKLKVRIIQIRLQMQGSELLKRF